MRVRAADGPAAAGHYRLPGQPGWLVGEERADGERRYYLTNHPAETPLRGLVRALKARWSCEQAHQQLKEELGLDHYEGRTWPGLHHHALLTMISFAFLQHLRLGEVNRRGKNPAPAPRSAAAAHAPRRPARRPRRPNDGGPPSPMSALSRPVRLPPARRLATSRSG